MFLAICGLTLPATAQLAPPDTADLIIFAQRVHVMAPGAKDGVAVAIRGTRILAVSTRIGVLRYRGAQTRLVRLNGAHVFPGLIDAHGDILGLGKRVDAINVAQFAAEESVKIVTRRQLLAAHDAMLRAGLTRVHDFGMDPSSLAIVKDLAAEGRWKIGVYGTLAAPASEQDLPPADDAGPRARLRFRAVRLRADGRLADRTAALLADYTDAAGSGGMTTSAALLRQQVAWCRDKGYQPCVDASGDRANRVVLDVLAGVLSLADRKRLRPRIEHAQVFSAPDLPRLAELDVVASMQPRQLTTGMAWALARLGHDRVQGAYAWRTLLDRGTVVAFGTNTAEEPEDPYAALFAAVTTRPPLMPEKGPYRPDQTLTRREAVAAFTTGAAYAAFEETVRGRIAAGYEADLTVVDRDLLGDGALLGTRVLATIVAGERVYQRRTGVRR